jgi:hypothetical protein
MSTDGHAEALKTYLATQTQAPVYDHDEAQALGSALPDDYTVIYLSRRFGGPERGETRDTNLRRLQTRVNAKKVANARLLEDRIAMAFEHKTVSLGDTFAHFAYEAGGGVYEFDEGYYTDLTDWTFAV